MRSLIAACLFAASACALLVGSSPGQPPKDDKKQEKKTQPKVDPKANVPDEETLKKIAERTEQLHKGIEELTQKGILDEVVVDVEVYWKAAVWIVRHGEWFTADSGKQTLRVLDAGLERAKAAADGKAPWRDVRGKPVVRGYRSWIDRSIQPYSLTYPEDFDPKNVNKKYRLDVVLHGRDASLTEVKFIHSRENAKGGKAPDHFILEVYGRGNNAYRWAGETDVFEAMFGVEASLENHFISPVDPNRIVLRGFSMGGAGTWHFGLHHPDKFCVIGPGAGFTTTHGYVGNLPKELPDYQEKCLHIYDAVDYAENAFNVPVVAYSGEKDPQKAAADNVEKRLMNFKEPYRFTHLIAPGLEHQMPAEWQAKAEAEYRKYADPGRDPNPARVRFVTYTPLYSRCSWLTVHALETTYQRAVVDATRSGNTFTVTTTNARVLVLSGGAKDEPFKVTVDQQQVDLTGFKPEIKPREKTPQVTLEKVKGKWLLGGSDAVWGPEGHPTKVHDRQGPIDDAFRWRFVVAKPTGPGWHPDVHAHATAAAAQFGALWDRYFRSELPVIAADTDDLRLPGSNLILFGDPASNPLIAKVLPRLPITWTKDKLVVNGVEYDPKTHVPVLTYPNPLRGDWDYVVINSGHTFKEADLKGTNALLYPRLGDWAVIKPTPTAQDPAAYEVVAAGLFDENWQFPKK
jgi:dienelactone hydrolase